MNKIKSILKNQTVTVVSAILAVASMFLVPPSEKYIDYINLHVLILLFCLMGAVAGFGKIGLFARASDFLLKRLKSMRALVFVLMNLCFFSSMLVTNDVALITFVPITIGLFEAFENKRSLILTVVIETAAANLGSMLTPIGNPQNIYLFSHFNMSAADFFGTILPIGGISYVLLCLLLIPIGKEKISPPAAKERGGIPKLQLVVFLLIFVVCVLNVARIVPDLACLGVTAVLLLIFSRGILLKIDYSLLLTFVCFFVFVGNIGSLDAVKNLVSSALDGRELIVAEGLSQFISNVPAAIMLSGFTDKAALFLIGVNVGGLGTPIASLASLISYRYYAKAPNAKSGRYLGIFSAVNFLLLAILTVICLLIY